MKRIVKDWLLLLASLADDTAFILLIILALWLLKIPITPFIIIFLILLFAVFVFLMHKFVIPTMHSKIITGSEGMVGLDGTVTKTLDPRGTIDVKGEHWKARALGSYVPAGEKVEIVAMDGLTLHVKRKKQSSAM
jgi:membrane-bound ClpP family serine protease